MKMTDKILNSFDDADEILSEKIEKLENASIISGKAFRSISSGGDSYNEVAIIKLPYQGSVLFVKPRWLMGQPQGLKLVRVSDNTVVAEIENSTDYNKLMLTHMNDDSSALSIQVKTNKSNPMIGVYYRIIP